MGRGHGGGGHRGGHGHHAMHHHHHAHHGGGRGGMTMVGGWGTFPVALGSADPTDDDRLPEAPVREGCLAKFCAALCSADRPRGVPYNAVLLPPTEQRELLALFQGARAHADFASSCYSHFSHEPHHRRPHARRQRQ